MMFIFITSAVVLHPALFFTQTGMYLNTSPSWVIAAHEVLSFHIENQHIISMISVEDFDLTHKYLQMVQYKTCFYHSETQSKS